MNGTRVGLDLTVIEQARRLAVDHEGAGTACAWHGPYANGIAAHPVQPPDSDPARHDSRRAAGDGAGAAATAFRTG